MYARRCHSRYTRTTTSHLWLPPWRNCANKFMWACIWRNDCTHTHTHTHTHTLTTITPACRAWINKTQWSYRARFKVHRYTIRHIWRESVDYLLQGPGVWWQYVKSRVEFFWCTHPKPTSTSTTPSDAPLQINHNGRCEFALTIKVGAMLRHGGQATSLLHSNICNKWRSECDRPIKRQPFT